MKFLRNRKIKGLGLFLGAIAIIINISSVAFSKTSYSLLLPAYKGVTRDDNSWHSKISDGGKGYNENRTIEGGSYALDYYMSNANNERRGDYKTIDEGYTQYFNNWGESGYLYYITGMNYSSVSEDVFATGYWAPDL